MSAESPISETESTVAATAFRAELPFVNRPKPRAFGVGRYGVSKFDERDDTRYAWGRVVPAVTALLFALLLGTPAKASNPYCEAGDAVTTQFQFCKPAVDVEGANRWGDKANTNTDMVEEALTTISAATATITSTLVTIAASTTALSVSTASLASGSATTYVTVSGDTMTGNLTMSGGVFIGNLTGTASDVTTNANMTGDVTSVGNATTISAGVVDTGKVAPAAITAPKIAPGAVETDKLAANSVTNAKTVGTSAVCGAGAFLGNATYVNGLPTGGSCSTAGVGDAVLASSQTFSGANTFTSSVTFSSSVVFNVVSSSCALFIARGTAYPDTGGTLRLGVARSTITWSSPSGKVRIIFIGNGGVLSAGWWSKVGFLVNSAYPVVNGITYTSADSWGSSNGNGVANMSEAMNFVTPAFSVAANVAIPYTLTATQNSASGTLCSNSSGNDPGGPCHFCVEEAR